MKVEIVKLISSMPTKNLNKNQMTTIMVKIAKRIRRYRSQPKTKKENKLKVEKNMGLMIIKMINNDY